MKMQWSFSRLKSFSDCGKKYYHMNVVKDVKMKKSKAMDDGEKDHKSIADNLTYGSPLPEHLLAHADILNVLASMPGEKLIERQIAFTEDWHEVDWFDETVASRFIYDFAVRQDSTISIWDWKTGARYPDSLQLVCFAIAAFYKWPEVNTVMAQFYWTKSGEIDPMTFTREQLPRLLALIHPKLKELATAYAENKWTMKKHYCSKCEVKLAGKCDGKD